MRLSDHDQRDAQHALRSEVSLVLARYARRMLEQGKAHITDAIAEANKTGESVNGITIGKNAALRVTNEYFAGASTEPAIEVSPTHQLTAGAQGSSTAGTSATSRTHRKR